jgi:hypothetical protein
LGIQVIVVQTEVWGLWGREKEALQVVLSGVSMIEQKRSLV